MDFVLVSMVESTRPRVRTALEYRSNRDGLIPLIYWPQIYRIDNLALRLMLPMERARKQGNVRRDH